MLLPLSVFAEDLQAGNTLRTDNSDTNQTIGLFQDESLRERALDKINKKYANMPATRGQS